MTNSRTTKKALLSSALALLMCVAMLIATTFAWFTDTASTSVNKIQAGKLDVGLYYEDTDGSWKDANGKKLGWKQATDASGTTTIISAEGQPLWEPGCTFSLPRLKIVNEGNLAFKYKIVISGITGNAELTEAIDWTMKLADTDVANGEKVTFEALGTDHELLAKSEGVDEAKNYDIFTISGHMKDDAGNKYQGLSIEGIAITVYATQLASEFDSTTDQYDKDALYDLKITESAKGNLPVTQNTGENAIVKTDTKITSGLVSVTYPKGVELKSEFQATGDTEKKASVEQSLEYRTDSLSSLAGDAGVKINADTQAVAQYDLTLPVDTDNDVLVPVEIDYEKNMTGLEVYHSGKKLGTSAASSLNTNGEYFTYDRGTGTLVLYLKHASPIDVVYVKPGTVSVNSVAAVNDAIKAGNSAIVVKDFTANVNYNSTTPYGSENFVDRAALHFDNVEYPNMADTITIYGDGTVKSNQMAIWAQRGVHLVINGGTYDNTSGDKGVELIYANNNSSIIVNDGTFMSSSTGEIFNMSNPVKDGNGGTIIIKGGLYNKPLKGYSKGENVTAWQAADDYDEEQGIGIKIADGYHSEQVRKNGTIWYQVVKDTATN